ncbi:MAG: serine/threonine protein phosphatase [Planctomycetales bacterium]|nr:serine/threonine protein phosphatase [Planctomycetales bacterium]
MSRTIAIGDIHGCSLALKAILKAIEPGVDDTIVTLGDYVDRGIDSKGVLDHLIALEKKGCLVPILGNHDQMMLYAFDGKDNFRFWLNCGGDSALDSYGSTSSLSLIPHEHVRFLRTCRLCFETETHIFMHANYRPEVLLDQLDDHTLCWLSQHEFRPPKIQCSGKTAVAGHSQHGEVLDLGYLLCIDTSAWNGGWLTALDVNSRQLWQANEQGELRSPG